MPSGTLPLNRLFRARIAIPFVVLLSMTFGGFTPIAQSAGNRPRLIVETDAGGDPDDEQSLVRFLLYANEWDLEGIIATRPQAREKENRNPERTGLGIVRQLVKAYGECHPNLMKHDKRYPDPKSLRERTVAGYADAEDGVKLILAAVDSDDPRPIWFLNWGTDRGSAPSCLKRALDHVLKERGKEGYAAFKNRLRLSSADRFDEHITQIDPPFQLWVDTFRPPVDGKRWYHRFSEITATAGGFDLNRDVLKDHGPLGALYPTNTTHKQKEGDTMTFLYLIPTGMNDPEQPTWGSWAGRYGRNPDFKNRAYYWANLSDTWQGTTHRDNSLQRWAVDLQNDFRSRMDWCVKPFEKANHAPVVVINGKDGTDVLRLSATVGDSLTLDATATTDPDGNELRYEWFNYPEAGTYTGALTITDGTTAKARLAVPNGAVGKQLHLILTVRDNGTPPLARYRRVVVSVAEAKPTPKLKP